MLSGSGECYEPDALSKIREVGTRVAVIGETVTSDAAAGADFVIELGSGLSEYGRMLLVMPLMQLFVYHRAVAAGRSAWIRELVYGPR